MTNRFWAGMLFCIAAVVMAFTAGLISSYALLGLAVLEGFIGVVFVVIALNDKKQQTLLAA